MTMVNRGTLVLNANAQPLTVVEDTRALRLALEGRVIVLAEYPQTIRSPSVTMYRPAVVMLTDYVPLGSAAVKLPTRSGVFVRDNWQCQYCGADAENIDHVVPRSRGGMHEWTNVVAACRKCNSAKADKLLSECGMQLLSIPVKPRVHHRFKRAQVPEWEPFLS